MGWWGGGGGWRGDRDPRNWGRWGGGGWGALYLTLHCHHLNDSGVKIGSDEGHIKISLLVKDKVTRQSPQTTTFEEKGEPKRIRTEILQFTSLMP